MKFVEKLMPGNRVWLIKENKEAVVCRQFLFSGTKFGTICLNINGNNVVWEINNDGAGWDNIPLLKPIDIMSDDDYLNYFTFKYKIDRNTINNIANKNCKNYDDVFYLIRKWIAEENCCASTGCVYDVVDF